MNNSMNPKKDLLTLLQEEDEPLQKRLKIANIAFKSCDLPLQHKEATLISWLAKNTSENNADVWKCFSDWVTTIHFKNLTRNDIDNKEMSSIVEIIAGERMNPTDDTTETLMVNVTLGIINNVSFQCYFKFNCNVYCNFLTLVMSKIRSLTNLKVFLKKIPLKYISSEDGFVAAFLKDTIHGLINCVKTFKDEDLFALASIIIQKVIPMSGSTLKMVVQ
ncbi:unnamed protein product [Callosobruchus maculatus]|uniref:Uncharacterized protein n=1 Tax=Callosobruchus maculatus TaxID=64391 RepID=A0A653C9B6_CALMS|nr:unnamed protein product [Callosobruchus maculatus]